MTFTEKIENLILPKVQKPGRYLGNEVHVIRKSYDQDAVIIILAFPDIYEMGMSYHGFDILYHVLNKQKCLKTNNWKPISENLVDLHFQL